MKVPRPLELVALPLVLSLIVPCRECGQKTDLGLQGQNRDKQTDRKEKVRRDKKTDWSQEEDRDNQTDFQDNIRDKETDWSQEEDRDNQTDLQDNIRDKETDWSQEEDRDNQTDLQDEIRDKETDSQETVQKKKTDLKGLGKFHAKKTNLEGKVHAEKADSQEKALVKKNKVRDRKTRRKDRVDAKKMERSHTEDRGENIPVVVMPCSECGQGQKRGQGQSSCQGQGDEVKAEVKVVECVCVDHKHARLRTRMRESEAKVAQLEVKAVTVDSARVTEQSHLSQCLAGLTEVKGQLAELQANQHALRDTVKRHRRDAARQMAAFGEKLAHKRCEEGQKWFSPRAQPPSSLPGGRVVRRQGRSVRYSAPFPRRPAVTAAITRLGTGTGSGYVRVYAAITRRTRAGFTLSVTGWGGADNHAVAVRWMACSR